MQSLQLHLVLELVLVLEAVVAGESAHNLAALPVVEDAAHRLTRPSRPTSVDD